MAKDVVMDQPVVLGLQRGVQKLADAVKVTMGPKGRNVALERAYGGPVVTKDGVTVAREVELPDPLENLGAQTVKEAAMRTASVAGDGTTSATVIAAAIFNRAVEYITAGTSPVFIQRGLQQASEFAIDALYAEISQPVSTKEDIAAVATLSSNGDKGLGGMIADAMENVGRDGVIMVEEGHLAQTTLEYTDGMQLDRGFAHSDYIPNGISAEYDEPIFFFASKKLEDVREVLPILEYVVKEYPGSPLVIFAHEVGGALETALRQNHLNGAMRVCPIRAPHFGTKRDAVLQDLAIATQGRVYDPNTGMDLAKVDPEEVLGRCSRVVVTKDHTTLTGFPVADEALEAYLKQLRTQEGQAESEHDREWIMTRRANLSGGAAIIRVGAPSELELKEFKARVEDALAATRSAVRSGVVPGGGTTYVELAVRVAKEASQRVFDVPEVKTGWAILESALRQPLHQIVANANGKPEVVAHELHREMRERQDADLVYNLVTETFENAFEAGVVDPALVIEQAIKNAVSSAGTLCTVSCAIMDKRASED